MTTNQSPLDDLLNEAGANAEESDAGWTTPSSSGPTPPEPETPQNDAQNGQVAVDEAREELNHVPARPSAAPAQGTERTDVDTASAIIRILDALRDLESVERDVATHLVAQGKELANEAETVLAVMAAPYSLVKTIRALLEARDLEPVERAFFLMKLDRSAARNMATLVSAFRNDVEQPSDHIELARVLVFEIGELESDDVSHVNATEGLFSAYEGGADSK